MFCYFITCPVRESIYIDTLSRLELERISVFYEEISSLLIAAAVKYLSVVFFVSSGKIQAELKFRIFIFCRVKSVRHVYILGDFESSRQIYIHTSVVAQIRYNVFCRFKAHVVPSLISNI